MTLKAVLVLLQVAILAAGMTLLGALVVEAFERSLRADADDLLMARAEVVEAAVRAAAVTGQAGQASAGSLGDVEPNSPGFEAFSEPRLFYEVWDSAGRPIAASEGLPERGLPWSPEAQAALESGQLHVESIPLDGRRRVRIVSRPVLDGGRVVAVVRVGESLQAIDQALNDLLRPLVVGGALVLLVCIVATWLVVSRALEPLEQIAATAERIALTGDVSLTVRPDGAAEVRRLTHSFNRMIERLRRLLDTQRQLLADTSHELRNPLTVVRTDLDLLGRDLDPDTRQEVAVEAQEEAERMSRLVADLLFLSREEQAAVGPPEPVRLDLLAEEVAERLRQVAPGHEVTVTQAETVVVPGNPDRLRQLVTNLIENAIRYTPAGGHVTVAVSRAHPSAARLDVADDGIGIPSEHLPRVFDRFYRVDPARGRATGGTGLGLAIVKHVAESHGGTVTATSTPGVGSTFSVTLPAATAGTPATSASWASTTPDSEFPGDPAAAPSGRAADSRPAGTPPTPDRPAPRR